MRNTDTPTGFGEYAAILRRRRVHLLTIIPAALLISVFLAFALPASYRSSATILLEPSSISGDLVQTTVTSYADQQIELVQRRVLTVDNLEPVVKEIDPYPDMPQLSAREKSAKVIADTILERVDPITLEVLRVSNAFSVHYHNADPSRAAAIAQRISDLFLSYNRKTRAERSMEAYTFLLEQSKEIERRIGEVDRRIEEFKTRHGSALPEAQVRNLAASERAERDLMSIDEDIRVAEERIAQLNLQLSNVNPSLGSTEGSVHTELATLQGQLADARVRYTPDHPDVRRLQRQIEALSGRAGPDSGGATVVPNNPEYLSIQSQIAAVKRELAALNSNAARARGQIYQYQSGIAAAPAVEREYAELVRARDALKAQGQDIQSKLGEADIARNLEGEQKGDRFSQIRAPLIAKAPYSPNRTGIILLGIVLGAGAAAALVALAESADTTVRGARDLHESFKIPIIASVPVMLDEVDRRRRLIWWGSYAIVLVAATAIVAATVVTA